MKLSYEFNTFRAMLIVAREIEHELGIMPSELTDGDGTLIQYSSIDVLRMRTGEITEEEYIIANLKTK